MPMYNIDNNNKNLRAVALKYEQGNHKDNAEKLKKASPKVVAKGQGDVAKEILALAESHGLLVHQDENLMQVLSNLDLGQEIPESLYHVIAELIAFSFVLQGKFPDSWKNTHQKIDFKE
ncbi:EscU/YscU/HrcU family type III secretion system export apparatus switch protein [Glaciecola petra]|uniref:EscU/YscU/HrcU family type III secretion system export apparatus switch protein n=1 Tax=Glaciecola petra TaxID=3075602 RepID=A0ABU2ZLY2_9ALTE|nr:EscU/YscU/HrcU family type III secretion system export apparatus switch protein [Aestuariibacter sp. P117]MDT0593639.1 EscU/YscU/HrcU family type III secretion system export apparatus switch protein [Aestuariibacter sp. P117]